MHVANACPSLSEHVSSVVGIRSDKQVTRIAALGIITVMAHEQLFWVKTVFEKVRYTAGFEVESTWSAHEKCSISTHQRCCPWPTLLCSSTFNFIPKSTGVSFVEMRDWYKLLLSHWISFVDRWSEPTQCIQHFLGSLYFITNILKERG
jgi:hypothetical protein